jgi:hypothetical protein
MGWLPAADWFRHYDGYRIEEREPTPDGGAIAMPGRAGGPYLIGNGGGRVPISLAVHGKAPVFLAFANLGRAGSTMGHFVEFANIYGLPTLHPGDDEMSVEELHETVRSMRLAVAAVAKGKAENIRYKFGGAQRPTISIQPGTQNLILKVESLEAFMWMEVLLAAQRNVQIKVCPICSGYMIPRSSKRETCSNACRQKAQRERGRTA